MNWLPFYNANVIGLGIISCFLWKLNGLLLFLVLSLFSIIFMLQENRFAIKHFIDAFYLFILSEVAIFFSLLSGCLWFSEEDKLFLSHYLEIPLMGTFLLIGSSYTVSLYHASFILNNFIKNSLLVMTIFLGFLFILLQGVEFSECLWSFSSSSYYGCCFSVIGLHLTHVFIGLVMLVIVLYYNFNGKMLEYYNDLVVIYWHFVDYIWLLVYFIVYIM
uniref:Cytochrome c oxidase subunit 3 n=1 Tax=Lepidotrema longipenis TaxID=330067 RepID=A0A346Q018_9PLAT|nr:cytochrome c oxidase subunit III [Lepidotrema longipenis]AXR86344.1 cytochrome c oxidase subunit 3 [Lepidotrema longipenis]